MLEGFQLYDRPLLASYPRSGTNWIRYIIECLSKRPTPGQERLVRGDDYVIDRAHCAFLVMDRYRKVVLVVRDYRECLLRQHRDHWPSTRDVLALLTDESIEVPAWWYMKNIEAFDSYRGEKLLIYYEDLVSRPEDSVTELTGFLGLDPDRTRLFLDHLDDHYEKSVAAYVGGGHLSMTSATRDVRHHARTSLDPGQEREFDEFYFSRHPELAKRYLSRYRVPS